ncbi:MAG: TonB-dependent receptor [Proteobacteria bacterium]|nr:TonB-dependent receptor [Pseudomonadota bacterium]
MTPLRGILCAFLPVVAAAPAFAQVENAPTLPSVVITADREPVPAERVTGTVTVITQQQMEQRQQRTVIDVLRTVPGVSVQQSGGPGSQTSVFLRGANSNHTVVLIDGMNIGDPSTPNGAIDFAHLATENLERIEVVRGPMSTLYGSGAIGGVINMVTRKGSGDLNGSVFTELGTRLQSTSGGYVRGSLSRFNYNVSANGVLTPGETVVPSRFTPPGGYVDNDAYRNVTFASRLGFEVNDNAQFSLFTRYIDTQVKYDQVGQEDPNATEFTQQLFNRLQFDGSFFNDRWKPTIGINYSTVYRHDLDFPSPQVPAGPFRSPQDATYSGRRMQADFKNVVAITDDISFVGGIDYDKTWVYTNADGAQNWGDARQTGVYGQIRGTFFDALTLSAGVRNDNHSQYGDNGTWRVGAAYLVHATDTKFKASYGTAFKAPAILELYNVGAFCAGNPNLQPERSRGTEAGVEQGLFAGKVKAGATFFENYLENVVQCVAPFATYTNVQHAKTSGVELTLDAQITSWLDIGGSYTLTYARDTDKNTPLLRRPENVFTGRVAVRPYEGVRLGAELLSVSGRHDANAITGATMEPSPYKLLRATAAYDIRKGVELFARAENILDQWYEEPEGFNAPKFQAFFGVKARF